MNNNNNSNNNIQFNLLPDVKLAFVKARRQKRLITFVSTWATVGAIGVVVVLLSIVQVYQRTRLSSLNNNIRENTKRIQSVADIEKILTIQNQLKSVTGLHELKPAANRVFPFLAQVVPNSVTISRFNISFDTSLIELTGSADKIETINKFIDTLKFTDYHDKKTQEKGRAFNSVVLATFGRDAREASYSITLNFKNAIFDSANDIELIVPNIVTTRSQTELPTALFQPTESTTETPTGTSQ